MTAYLIATTDVHDPGAFAEYRAKVPEFVEAHGGRAIVRDGAREVVEGAWPDGNIVILEFPDPGRANAFADDPRLAPVAAIRRRAADSHIWIVEGVADGPAADGMHAFLLCNIRLTDRDRYKPYAERVPTVLAEAGGTYLARGGRARAVEGDMRPDRLVIVGFADMDAMRAFHGGEIYAPLRAVREAASDSNIVMVEGL